MLCTPCGVRGIPGAGVGHGGHLCEPVSGPHVCWGPWSWRVGTSFLWGSFSPCGVLTGSPLHWALPQRECIMPPPPQCQLPWRRRWQCRRSPSHRPLWGHCWPLGKLSASSGTAGRPPIPCGIPQLTLPAGSFKGVNLKYSGKMYICEWCKRQPSNQDSVVSHCLQEHLGICLVCPQCGMSYLDPSKFNPHSRGIHNLLFY